MIVARELTAAQRDALEGAVPTPQGWAEVTGIVDAHEILRSPKISNRTLGKLDQQIREGGVQRLDGSAHAIRRKTLNRLVRRDGHAWYRETVLYPTVAQCFDEIFHDVAPGVEVAIDLVAFSNRANTKLAAAIVGFDIDSEEALAELERLDAAQDPVSRLAVQEILYKDIDDSMLPAYFAATEALLERFYKPSLARRQELLRKVEAGELPDSALPRDLLTLIAGHSDPGLDDPIIGFRDAMAIFRPAQETASQALTHAIAYLDAWFKQHPEDHPLRTDPDFLLAAANETLRFGIGSSQFVRRAIEDVVLSSGTEINAGQYVIIRSRAANRDPLYGPDAGEFNPHRAIPEGLYAFGLGFGSGPHMCFGIPLVLGNEGIDGGLVYLLRKTYEVGVRPNPDSPPTRRSYARPDMTHYGTFPALVGASRA